MKRIYTAIASLLIASASAYALNAFQYQATVMNSDGSYAAGKELTVRLSVVDGDGNTAYSETHDATTDNYGNFGVMIGRGTVESGSFDLIDWSKTGMQLKTEIDRGEGYTLSGEQPFNAVPFAQHAKTAAGIVQQSPDGTFWRMTVDDNGNLGTEKVVTSIIPIPEGYTKMVFNDEFNGEGAPNPEKWSYEVGYVRNDEDQYYNDSEKNVFQKDGNLNIVCYANDPVYDKNKQLLNNKTREVDGTPTQYKITSGSIHTRDKAKWTYCRIDVRAKLPTSLGTWPAIWLMPNDDVYGYWPNSGEIDIMEHVGYDPQKVYFTAHCAEQNGANNRYSGNYKSPVELDFANNFHVYSLIWEKDKMYWLVDNQRKFAISRSGTNSWRGWPYNRDFYAILNFAFGGSWGGREGMDVTALPLTYYVDYIRVFQ